VILVERFDLTSLLMFGTLLVKSLGDSGDTDIEDDKCVRAAILYTSPWRDQFVDLLRVFSAAAGFGGLC
jgi:hypothetical protein